MSNTIEVWYDAVLKQMAAEVYLEGVSVSDLDRVKDVLVGRNN